MDDVLENLEILFDSPLTLGRATPDEWHRLLKDHGYDVRPLSGGNFKGVPYEQGGGFKVNWNGKGGASIFQYHPEERSHHDGAYYKTSNGLTGVRWYALDGSPKNRK